MRLIFSIPHVGIGGFSSFVLNLGGELRRRGHWVGVVVARPYGTLFDEISRNLDCTLIFRRGFTTRRQYVTKFLAAMIELQVDVILNSGVAAVQAAFPYLPAHIGRMSVVHSVHAREVYEGSANAVFTDCIVSVAPNVTAALAKRCGDLAVREIPVGVPTDNEPSAPGSRDADPLKMVYCGRLTATAKNLTLIIQMLAELHRRGVPFTFTFIGDGEMRPTLEAQVENTPYSSQIRFLGSRTPSEIPALLAPHDLFVLCSQYEGTPHALLEAMAVGVPCVAPRLVGSTDAIIQNGVTGFLCDKLTACAYTDLIEHLSENRLLLRTVGLAGKAIIRQNYSVEVMADSYMRAVEEALTARRHGLLTPPVKNFSTATGSALVDPALNAGFHSLPRAVRTNIGDLYRWVNGIRPAAYPDSAELTRWRRNPLAEEGL